MGSPRPSNEAQARELAPLLDEPEWPSGPVGRFKPTSRPVSHLTPGSVCPKIVAGVRVVLDWREARMRRTRAEWLRAELDLIEWSLEARRRENRVAA